MTLNIIGQTLVVSLRSRQDVCHSQATVTRSQTGELRICYTILTHLMGPNKATLRWVRPVRLFDTHLLFILLLMGFFSTAVCFCRSSPVPQNQNKVCSARPPNAFSSLNPYLLKVESCQSCVYNENASRTRRLRRVRPGPSVCDLQTRPDGRRRSRRTCSPIAGRVCRSDGADVLAPGKNVVWLHQRAGRRRRII